MRWRSQPQIRWATPSVRMVLLKGHGPNGFAFYTNEESNKGKELEGTPPQHCSSIGRPSGARCGSKARSRRVSDEDADAYFATPRAILSWAPGHPTSRGRLRGREVFEARYEEMKARFEGQSVPRPPHWGGFALSRPSSNSGSDRPIACTNAGCSWGGRTAGWSEGFLYP